MPTVRRLRKRPRLSESRSSATVTAGIAFAADWSVRVRVAGPAAISCSEHPDSAGDLSAGGRNGSTRFPFPWQITMAFERTKLMDSRLIVAGAAMLMLVGCQNGQPFPWGNGSTQHQGTTNSNMNSNTNSPNPTAGGIVNSNNPTSPPSTGGTTSNAGAVGNAGGGGAGGSGSTSGGGSAGGTGNGGS